MMLMVIVKFLWIAITAFEVPENFTDRGQHYAVETDA